MAWYHFFIGSPADRAKSILNKINSKTSMVDQVAHINQIYKALWNKINAPSVNLEQSILDLKDTVNSKKQEIGENLKELRSFISILRGDNESMRILDTVITDHAKALESIKSLVNGVEDLWLSYRSVVKKKV